MKNIYLLVFSLIGLNLFSQTNLTLTKAAQEPLIGDNRTIQYYDSVGVIPKSTGPNQIWNFSSIVQTTDNPITTTFVTLSSVPSASIYTGATIAEEISGGNYLLYKSTNTPTTQWESLGVAFGGTVSSGISYTNSLINMIWPMAPNDSFTDTYFANYFGINLISSENGTSTVNSSGSGTITLLGGSTYANAIQIKTLQKVITSNTYSGTTSTYTNYYTIYDYYHSSQKFPLLTVRYSVSTYGFGLNLSYDIIVNKVFNVGLKEKRFDNSLSIFPNPAKDKINFQIDNVKAEKCSLEIQNLMGQQIKLIEFGNRSSIKETISIDDLEKGIYLLITTLGENVYTQKLLVE